MITGSDPISKAMGEVSTVINDVEKLFELVASSGGLTKLIPTLSKFIGTHYKRGEQILSNADVAMQDTDALIGTPFVFSFLNLALGLDLTKQDKDTSNAIKTMQMMIGFCVVLSYSTEIFAFISKIIGAGRIGDNFLEKLAKIPEEMGISWALGMILNSAFEQSVGQAFEEFINEQKRPARLNVQELMRILRQHRLPESEVTKWLTKLGFPNDLQDLLKKLDTTQLPISDVVTAALNGYIDHEQLQGYIQSLGFVGTPSTVSYNDIFDGFREKSVKIPSDAEIVWNTYLSKAETQASSVTKVIARKAYLDYLLSESQFRAMLATANVPELSISQELVALNFERKHVLELSKVDLVKRNFIAGVYHPQEVYANLEKLGMHGDDIANLITSWQEGIQSKRPALTATKLIALYKNGILSESQTVNQLTSLGYYPTNAQLLVDHPDSKSNSGGIPFTKDNLLSAYQDNIISESDLRSKLTRLGLTEPALGMEVTVADYLKTHHGVIDSGHKPLSQNEIQSAFRSGRLSDLETITLLEEDGYAVSDAEVIWAMWYESKHGKPPPGDSPNPPP